MRLLDALFPVPCAGCGAPGGPACVGCRHLMAGRARQMWPRPAPAGLPPPWAVAAYADEVRAMVIAYKERDAVGLSRALAAPLATAIAAAASPHDGVALVPIPSSRRAIRERGDDVLLRLVRRAAYRLRTDGIRVTVVGALHHTRSVADSAGLDSARRAANLSGAFGVRPGAFGRVRLPVVIVDDVMTTGATIAEAARALQTAGVRVEAAAVIAATQRRGVGGLLGATPNGATVRATE